LGSEKGERTFGPDVNRRPSAEPLEGRKKHELIFEQMKTQKEEKSTSGTFFKRLLKKAEKTTGT